MRPHPPLKRTGRSHASTQVFALLFVLGVVGGVSLMRHDLLGQVSQNFSVLNTTLGGALAPIRRAEVPVDVVRSKRTMVALVFGQSNAANSGETRYRPRQSVYNFYRGKLYLARDPLLGATGRGGSVWTRLGDKLIDRMAYESVVFVPLGVGATSITRWTVGGDLHEKVLRAVREVKGKGLTITHLLWHQGESDVGRTSTQAYKRMFQDMVLSIREQGVDAPVYVSLATRCHTQKPDETIRRAQRELVSSPRRIYAGPDTDTLGLRYRYDRCHFSAEGLERFAELWLEALVPQ